MFRGEIDNDAEPESDREPRQKMRRSDLFRRPLAQLCRDKEFGTRPG
jgi:hypothetical protein